MSATRKIQKEEEVVEAEVVADDALPAERWWAESSHLFGVAPEIVKNALEPGKSYTLVQVEGAVAKFLARPVG